MKKRSIIIFLLLMVAVLIHRYNPILFDFNWIHNLYGPNIFLRTQELLPRIIGLIMLGLTFILGPIFCGWLCPFGTFQEIIYCLAKPFKLKVKLNSKLNQHMKYIKYFHLLIVVYLVMNNKMIHYIAIDPYHGLFKLLIGGITLYAGLSLITVIILSFFFERPYCQWFCPYGAGLNLLSVFRVKPIERTDHCISCHKCDAVCPMTIKITDFTTVKAIDCISCNQCIKACPVENALVKRTKFFNLIISSIIMIIIIIITQPKPLPVIDSVTIPMIPLEPAIVSVESPTHHVFFNYSPEFIDMKDLSDKNYKAMQAYQEQQRLLEEQRIAEKLEAERLAKLEAEKQEALENDRSEGEYYYDGTYKATVNGFAPDMVVQITIKNDQITSVEILEHDESRSYFNFASPKIIHRILDQNTADVKIVAGATYTSRGIKNGVRNCLNQALK